MITARESAATVAADELREQIHALSQQLSALETELADPNCRPGGFLEGQVRVAGGDHAVDVEYLAVGLITRVEVETGDVWLLTGAPGTSARVESGGSKLSADRVEVDRRRQQVRGEGSARAVFAPDPGEKKPAPVSFVGDRKRPTYGKADRIVLDDAAKVATLTGKASLWQDDSSLFADSITLSDAEKTVVAVQNVRAVVAPSPSKESGKRAEKQAASVVTSRRMRYRDSDRSARFENGVALSGGGNRTFTFRVGGAKAAHGTIVLHSGRRLTGSLDGHRISVRVGAPHVTAALASAARARALPH